MPYFVAWEKDGRVRRFAYPHVNLETALGFAYEILVTESCDVWVSNEQGEKIADQHDVAQYADGEAETAEESDEN